MGKIRIAVVIVVIAAALGLQGAVFAKSYRIDRVDLVARLQADGSMLVSETRTYAFSGSFSYAYRDMPRRSRVTFDGFEVLENGRPYALSDSDAPGNFQVSATADRIRITWHYRASDESRTFEFRYLAREAVERYNDAAVLYYKFLSEEWEIPQNGITLRVLPPEPISRQDIREWLHGPLWAESRITESGEILAECSRLPARTFLAAIFSSLWEASFRT